jgi:phosphatidylglycerophosphatase A
VVKNPSAPWHPWLPISIATAGGVGFLPLMPGTFGSIVGAMLFVGFSCLSLGVHLPLVLALSLVGIWASDHAEVVFEQHDDGRIVIDEVVGQLLTLTPLIPLCGLGLQVFGGMDVFYSLVVTGFVAFRVLDVWKPGVVRWAERNISGGAGVMADDLLAGALGALLLAVPVGMALYGAG